MNDLDTVMSVSTLQGFAVAKLGMDVQQLVASLNIGNEEWQFIKENYDHVLRLFKPEQLASIERYFEESEA